MSRKTPHEVTTHLPKPHTAPHLVARCGRYRAVHIGGMEDPRRDRFTDGVTPPTCAYCAEIDAAEEEAQVRAGGAPTFVTGPAVHVKPQAWEHADVEARSRRGEAVEAPPFRNWRAALRVMVLLDDEGTGAASCNLEPIGGPSSGTPDGDKGQRSAARIAVVRRELEAAYTEPFVLREYYPAVLALAPDVCRWILIQLVVGREVKRCPVLGCDGTRCEKRKHTKIKARSSWVVEETREDETRRMTTRPLADHVSEMAGWERGTVTAGHLAAIERLGGLRIDEALGRRGLVLHRDEALRKAAQEMGHVLKTKAAIGKYLGMSEDTVERALEWEPPIPMRRVGGRWEADEKALDEWRAKEPGPRKEVG